MELKSVDTCTRNKPIFSQWRKPCISQYICSNGEYFNNVLFLYRVDSFLNPENDVTDDS